MIGQLTTGPRDILNPETQQFPYWPDWYFQPAQNIPAQQNDSKLEDIRINQVPTLEQYQLNDLRVLYFPQSPQQQVTDVEALQPSTVIYGVGNGQTLTDMLMDSHRAWMAQGTAPGGS